jgi:hypothetical protein
LIIGEFHSSRLADAGAFVNGEDLTFGQ